jgi:hypothetical protein
MPPMQGRLRNWRNLSLAAKQKEITHVDIEMRDHQLLYKVIILSAHEE